MGQTVIGFFKEASDAQKAAGRLQGMGVSRVNVSTGEYLDGTADREGRNTNKFTDIFNKLFGHDSDDAKRYSTIGQRNVTMVTVHAESKEKAEEVADLLDDCGAVDVDDDGSSSHVSGRAGGDDSLSRNDVSERSGWRAQSGGRRSWIVDRSLDEEEGIR